MLAWQPPLEAGVQGSRRGEAHAIFPRKAQNVAEYGLTIVIVVLLGVGSFRTPDRAWFTGLAGRITTVSTRALRGQLRTVGSGLCDPSF